MSCAMESSEVKKRGLGGALVKATACETHPKLEELPLLGEFCDQNSTQLIWLKPFTKGYI